MTRRIIEEIKFYDIVKPLKKLREGVFGSGCGIYYDEHLIKINLDIKDENVTYRDTFEWDVLNEENM